MQRLPQQTQTSFVELEVKDHDFIDGSKPVEVVGELHQQAVNEVLHALIDEFMRSSDLSDTNALFF